MTPRRLAALKALAERGATEGERAAARNALDAYEAEQRERQTQSRARTRPPFNTATEAERLFDKLFRAGIFSGNVVVTDSYRPPFRERQPPQHPKPPTPEPRVTQMRRATAADFPDLPTATVDPSNPDVLVVECVTAAAMWQRFQSLQPWRVVWQGFVWTAPIPCGTMHDRAKSRFYVKIDRRQLREVVLPV